VKSAGQLRQPVGTRPGQHSGLCPKYFVYNDFVIVDFSQY